MIPILRKIFNRTESLKKWHLCVFLLVTRVLKVGIRTLNADLNTLQEAGASPTLSAMSAGTSRTFLLLDTEAQLDLQATGIVAVSSGLHTVLISTRWTTGFGEPARTVSSMKWA